jgi:hypothetical protein
MGAQAEVKLSSYLISKTPLDIDTDIAEDLIYNKAVIKGGALYDLYYNQENWS